MELRRDRNEERERAIAALRKAVEIEPDNALYRTNLEKLEKAEN